MEDEVAAGGSDKSFGFSKQFTSWYEVGEEVGEGILGIPIGMRLGKKWERAFWVYLLC